MHERRNAKCQKSGRKVTSSKKKVVLLKVEEAKGPFNRADASPGGSETIATWEPLRVFFVTEVIVVCGLIHRSPQSNFFGQTPRSVTTAKRLIIKADSLTLVPI